MNLNNGCGLAHSQDKQSWRKGQALINKRPIGPGSSPTQCGRWLLGIVVGMAVTLIGMQSCAAETLTDFFKQSTFSGTARAYYFTRDYGSKTKPNQDAFAIGGLFNLQTAEFFDGFSVDASFFTANSLGVNNLGDGGAHIDSTLIGDQNSVTALGQAYLQYKSRWALVKAGDQIIRSPWLGDSDSRILPATYQGLYADVTPTRDLHLYAFRVFRWKSRTSGSYYRDNLYYPATWSGDTAYGGTDALPLSAPLTQCTAALGGSYKRDGASLKVWYYDFRQFANLAYVDGDYTFKTGTGFKPFLGAQYVREWKGSSLLNGVPYNGLLAGAGVDALAYGFKAGMDSPYGQLMLAYENLASNPGAVGGGAIVSPYTSNYTTDPLYTSSMIYGEVERGPGHSWKIKYTRKLFVDKLLLVAAFARYNTIYNGTSNNTYADITYFLSGDLKGLSLRDRVEDAVFGDNRGPGGGSTFIYNRFMVQYDF